MFSLSLFGPAAILLAAVLAWIVQTRISIRRATIDFISTHEIGNPRWSEATQLLVEISVRDDAAQALIALLTPETPEELAQRHQIASILNYYEGVAVGIKHKAISPQIYKDWNGSGYVNTWNLAQSYITARRQTGNRTSAYSHLEELAKKWMKEGIKPDSGRRPRPCRTEEAPSGKSPIRRYVRSPFLGTKLPAVISK